MVGNSRIDRAAKKLMTADPSLSLRNARTQAARDLTTADPAPAGTASYLKALGITDPKTWSPVDRWAERRSQDPITIPLGHVVNADGTRTGELAVLNLADIAKGGTGPHGAMVGATGSGKSICQRAMLLSLAALYSPGAVNFAVVDGKGGSSHRELEKLPHHAGSYYVGDDPDDTHVLLGFAEHLRSELRYRQELIEATSVADAVEYRALREKAPNRKLAPLPQLIVVIDELMHAPIWGTVQQVVESTAQVGRALGVSILLSGQNVTAEHLGGAAANLTYGIALKTSTPASSQTVIHDPAAVDLPLPGEALFHSSDNALTRLRIFDISEAASADHHVAASEVLLAATRDTGRERARRLGARPEEAA